ncbi:MAG TPA: YIP1 family protein [Terriglobales bacterium]|nr:YIP1 family protein [Terriglobales bacterium]
MSSVAPVSSQAAPLSQLERVVDTFVAPSKTFTDLRRSANWLMPVVLLVIATEALVFTADRKIGFEKIAENGLAMQPKAAARLDQLSPEQRAKQMDLVVKVTSITSYLYPAIMIVFLFIIAAILLATFNYGAGAELSLNQCVAVVMYASLPGIIKALLAIVALMVGGGDSFTFQNPVASNLSPLVDPSSHFLYAVAMNLDLFTIWTLLLSGIGFACLTKVKRGTSLGIVFGWWAVWVLGSSAAGAAFS